MKKIIRMAAMLAVAGAALLTSCTKDYSADIDSLNTRMDAAEKSLTAIQGQIANGAILTAVNKTANGIQVVTTNGTYDITNGKDGAPGAAGAAGAAGAPGKDGSVWTIGEDGFWYCDGEKTDYAKGSTVAVVDGKLMIDGEEAALASGITAVWDEEKGTLVIYGVEGFENGYVLGTNVEIGYMSILAGDVYNNAYYHANASGYIPVNIANATEKANVFGPENGTQLSFTEGASFNRGTEILVRVSPANAKLDPSKIQLINTKGEALENVVVEKIVAYDKLMTQTQAKAGENGLYKVTFNLKANSDWDAFKKAVRVNYGTALAPVWESVLWAVKAGDAISGYDVTVTAGTVNPASALDFLVDETPVAQINNRYSYASNPSILEAPATLPTAYVEKKWAASTTDLPTPAVAMAKKGTVNNWVADSGVPSTGGDDRHDLPVYQAVQGKPFTVSLGSIITPPAPAAPYFQAADVKGMYVVLDTQNAVESSSSEISAWKYYSYEGLNNAIEGTELDITVNCDDQINDIIGFRVYAVNWDGTLVDPDGKAFYVQIGAAANEWNSLATTITPAHETIHTTPSAKVAATVRAVPSTATATWTTDALTPGGAQPIFDVQFLDKNNTVVATTANLSALVATFSASTFDPASVVAIQTVKKNSTDAWTSFKDGKAYNGKLVFTDASRVVAIMTASMTKVLPTATPAGYSPKTNQIVNGVYNCYLVPDSWAASTATAGTMPLVQAFNFPAGLAANYNFSFAESQPAAAPATGDVAVNVNGAATLNVDKKYINNATKHATSVVYNFGKISSERKHPVTSAFVDYTLDVDSFETVYNCIYNSTYSWSWVADNDAAAREALGTIGGVDYEATYQGRYTAALPKYDEIVYGGSSTTPGPISIIGGNLGIYVKGVSSRDALYSAYLKAPYNSSLAISSATLTSNSNGIEEYMQPTVASGAITGFTTVSSSTNPVADVPSTLTIKAKDMFGHDVEIKLPITVKTRN
ncbi:MAG: cell surface protein [Bacteroidales bacterium]|nr:cell surface protein [Bacteroidales bacterium]